MKMIISLSHKVTDIWEDENTITILWRNNRNYPEAIQIPKEIVSNLEIKHEEENL